MTIPYFTRRWLHQQFVAAQCHVCHVLCHRLVFHFMTVQMKIEKNCEQDLAPPTMLAAYSTVLYVYSVRSVSLRPDSTDGWLDKLSKWTPNQMSRKISTHTFIYFYGLIYRPLLLLFRRSLLLHANAFITFYYYFPRLFHHMDCSLDLQSNSQNQPRSK